MGRRNGVLTFPRVQSVAPYLLLGVLCAAFFWRVWTPNPVDRASFAAGDFSGQFFAFAKYQAERLWQGQLPLWNPYVYAGHPFWADVQSASAYPPRWLTILLSGPNGFSYFALEVEAIVHVFLAGAFTFAFAGRLLGDRAAAFLAAVVVSFGGYLTSYPILQLAILETITWLPLVLLLIDRAFTDPGARSRLASAVGAGLVWAVALLAGHPQTAMQLAYVGVVYGVWQAASRQLGRRAVVWPLALFGLIGLGASAAQWVPALEFTRLSTRSEFGYDALAGGFALRDVVQVLLPGTASVWSPLYIGVVPLLLAFGSFLSERRRLAMFWLAVAAGAFVLSLGGATFWYALLYQWVPGFNLFRSQERAAGVVSFALAIAAGVGATLLRSSDPARLVALLCRVLTWTALGLLVMASLLFVVWQLSAAPDVVRALDQSVFALLLVGLTIALLRWRPFVSATHTPWTLVLIGLVVFDLFTINWRTDLDMRAPESQPALPASLQSLPIGPELVRTDERGQVYGNWGNLLHVYTVNGISPLVFERYARVREALPREQEWKLFNVKYVVTNQANLSVPAELIASGEWTDQPLNVFQLSDPTPRAWLVHRVRVLADDAALAALADLTFDPRREALVAEPVDVSAAAGPSDVHVVSFAPEHIVVEVDAAAPGLLVLSELDYPGWGATVDGVTTPLVRADVVLRSVLVPAGRHRVELSFQPASVWLGLAVSGVTWTVGLMTIAWLKRRPARLKVGYGLPATRSRQSPAG